MRRLAFNTLQDASKTSFRNNGKLYFSRRCLSAGPKAGDESKGSNSSKENSSDGSIFSEIKKQMQETLEKDPKMKKTIEEMKANADKSGETFSKKFSEYTKSSQESFEKMNESVKENEKLKGMFSDFSERFKKTSESAKPNKSTSSKSETNSSEGLESKFDLGRFSQYLPEKFGNDETTWNDAFRSVFGLKPIDKIRQREEMIRQRKEELAKQAEAQDPISEEPKEEVPVEDPAKDLSEPPPPPEKSFHELKLEELGAKISKLEEQREAVAPSSENPDLQEFKKLNKEIKQIRTEMQDISKKMNTTSLVFKEQDKGTWDKFTENLKDTPLLKNILGFGEKVTKSETVKSAKDAAEDARNAWETSQNPIVYRMYSVYEGIFKENETAQAVKEFRKIDPEFTIDGMTAELEEEVIPQVLTAYLRGDPKVIEKHCEGEALNGIKASIKMRIESKKKMDSNILSIDNMNLLAMKNVDKIGPIAVVQFMVQQIDCLYDLEGNVVEGKDDKIVAVFYVMALTRRYMEEELKHSFICKEFAVVGTQPYL